MSIVLDENGYPVKSKAVVLDEHGYPLASNAAAPIPYQSPKYGPTGPTGTQMAQDLSAQFIAHIPDPILGLPGFVKDAATAFAGGPGAQGQFMLDTAKSIARPLATMGQNALALGQNLGVLPQGKVNVPIPSVAPASEERNMEAAGFGGAAVGSMIAPEIIKPVAKVAGKAASMTKAAIQGTDTAATISRRVTQSILKPPEASKLSGADPVAEVMQLEPSASVKGIREKVQAKMATTEDQLQAAIDDRRQAAKDVGMEHANGIDVEPILRSRVQTLIDQALRNGEGGVARSLNQFMNARLADIKNRLGSTYLTPEQILAEKRIIRDEINFKSQEVLQQNKNAAKLGVYRGLDSALDTLVPAAEPINKSYSGLVVADKLLETQLHRMGNADVLSGTMTGNLKKVVPTAIKTNISNALTPTAAPISVPNVYEFHQPPRVGPYESGYQPSQGADAIAPHGFLNNAVQPEVIMDPYTGKVRGYANRNLPVRVQGIPLPSGPTADTNLRSIVTATTGERPATTRGYPAGTPGAGSVVGKGASLVLSHVEPGITGVRAPVYVYTELGSGKMIRSSVPLPAQIPQP